FVMDVFAGVIGGLVAHHDASIGIGDDDPIGQRVQCRLQSVGARPQFADLLLQIGIEFMRLGGCLPAHDRSHEYRPDHDSQQTADDRPESCPRLPALADRWLYDVLAGVIDARAIARRALVLWKPPGDDESNTLTDVHRMVADALVEPGDERQLHSYLEIDVTTR